MVGTTQGNLEEEDVHHAAEEYFHHNINKIKSIGRSSACDTFSLNSGRIS